MSGRCATCKHWDPRKYGDDWGYCEMANYDGGHECDPGMSTDPKDDPHGRVHKESLCVANDVSGYAAQLVTSPDFGCVQWAAKEPT